MATKVTQRMVLRYAKNSVTADELSRFSKEMKKVGIAVVALEFNPNVGFMPTVELLAGAIQVPDDMVQVRKVKIGPPTLQTAKG